MSLNSPNKTPGKARTDSPVQRQIDENLKRIFDETANEPLPDKLTSLLSRLRAQESRE